MHSVLVLWGTCFADALPSKEMFKGFIFYSLHISRYCVHTKGEGVNEFLLLSLVSYLLVKVGEGTEWRQTKLTWKLSRNHLALEDWTKLEDNNLW